MNAPENDPYPALLEIASVTSSFLIIEWVVQSLADDLQLVGLLPLGLAFLLIFRSHRARGEKAVDLGWRFDNFLAAARLLLPPMLGATLVLLLAGWFFQSVGLGALRTKNYSWWMPYPVWLLLWGLAQQYVLQGFINRRAQSVFGPGRASVTSVAALFALLHAPNPWVMLASLAGGCVWAAIYQRAPNLFALALSHALMTLVMIVTLPHHLLRGMQVGFGALR